MNQNNNQGQKKGQKRIIQSNPLESLKEIGKSTAQQMRQEAARLPGEFMDQLLGRRYTGEIEPGEALDFNEVLFGQREEILRLKKQAAFERRLLEEERVLVERKTNELKIHLEVIQTELITLADKTEDLAEETQIAAMQAPIEPGAYHVVFFEKLLGFIKSFRKKIEEAGEWLHASNKRASKKNMWGQNYKKYGAKYLLSGEHYLSRSAG
jgi:hypothetical protein